MKALIVAAALLIFIIGNIGAVDIQSYQFIDHLRSISAPEKPEIYGDSVLFTAPSTYKRLGISFAYEGYAKVYWFKRLVIPKDNAELFDKGKIKKNVNPNQDSGIMFHIQAIPEDLKDMDYRLVIDGLWTTDPLNPLTVAGPSGVVASRIPLGDSSSGPGSPMLRGGVDAKTGTYRFVFQAPPGETVTVGGSFNNWDPFMYELQEVTPGFYTLALPLPAGMFQYVFFHRGELIPDQDNVKKVYSRDGRIVSQAEMP
ncbi:MAG: isoamylase [Treponema sp.]|nr:isoamylase [Treponema sp.]